MKRLILLTAALCACTASLLAQEITPEVKARAAEIVSKMTLEEKIGYISGDEDGFSIKAVPGVETAVAVKLPGYGEYPSWMN